jgi:molybdopterin converting factor subunit 1
MIEIMLFAGLKEKLQRETIACEYHQITVGQLKEWLCQEFPQMAEDLARVMIAVNESFAQDETVIDQNDRVALIPPVSGG